MPNFVEDNDTLPYPKADLVAIPSGASETRYLRASDWNDLCTAVVDVQTFLRGAKWVGLDNQSSDPVPSGITNYAYLGTDNKLYIKADVLRALVDEQRQIIAGSGLTGGGTLAADRTLALADTAVIPGSYTAANITVDAKGRLTSAASGSVVAPTRQIIAGSGLTGGGDLSADRTLALADTAVSAGSYDAPTLTVDAKGRLTAASASYHVNVRTYGAIGDGTTDDRAAINSAIAAAKTLGCRVLFPSGYRFKISKYLLVQEARGLTLYSNGVGAVIQYASDDAAVVADGTAVSDEQARAALFVLGSSDVRVEGITFEGNDNPVLNTNLGSGVYASRSQRVTVRDCVGLYGYALFVSDCFADTNGTGDSLTTASSGLSTLADSVGSFKASHVGHMINISGCTNQQNDGSYLIKAFVSSTQVTIAHPSATAETSSFRWTLDDGDRGHIVACNKSIAQRSPMRVPRDSSIEGNLIERTGNVDVCGIGDYLSISGTTVTLTDAAGRFLPSHNGKLIRLAGQPTSGALTLSITAATATLTRGSGSFVTDGFVVGQRVVLTNFANAGNNSTRTLATVAALTMTFTDNAGLVDETGSGDEVANSGNNSDNGNPIAWAVTYISATQVSFTNANGFTGAFSGTWWIPNGDKVGLGNGATALAKSSSTMTLTAATNAFTANDVGKTIRIAKATSAGNNSAFTITAYVAPNQVQWTNASGTAETFSGVWSVDAFDNSIGASSTHGSTHGIYIFAGNVVGRSNIRIIGNTFRYVRTTCVKISGSSTPIRDIIVADNYAEECGEFTTAGADDSQEHTGMRFERNMCVDCGTGSIGRTQSHVFAILGSRGTVIRDNTLRFTRNAIGSVSGGGIAGINLIDCNRYVAGVSQPIEDLAIEGNKIVVDPTATSVANLMTYAMNAGSVGLRAKYRTGGTLTRHSTGNITMGVTAATGTFTRSAGSFITDGFYVGGSFVTTGYANGGNNTTKTIATISATVITVTSNAGLVDEAGSGDETASNGTMTLTDSSAVFSPDEVGKSITFVFSTTAANDVTATILSRPSSTTLTFINTAGVAQAIGGTYRIPERSGQRASFLRVAGNQSECLAGTFGFTNNVGLEFVNNTWSNAGIEITGDCTPRVAHNRQVGTNTTASIIRLRDGTSWPIVHDNTITNPAIGSSIARDIGISSGPSGSTIVDYPLLGKRGRAKPAQAQTQVVFPYGSGYVDGDTVIVNSVTYTYKTSGPTGNQFNSFASLLSLIDGQAGYSAADYGTQFSPAVTTQHIRVWRDAAGTADDFVSVSASTLNPTACPYLRNQTASNANAFSRGAASTTSTVPDRTVIWTPLATWAGSAQLIAENEAARTLLGDGSVATGSIVCVTKANLVDGETVTISDGINPAKVYEFDLVPNGVAGANVVVDVSTDTTATQVGDRLVTAINTAQPFLNAVNASGTITVTHKLYGAIGNVTITETVANAGFTVAGMLGGSAGGYRKVSNSLDAGCDELIQHAKSGGTEEFRWVVN